MRRYHIRLTDEAEDDLVHIYSLVRKRAASAVIARNYTARIRSFLERFDIFPERGSMRDDIRPGLRCVDFERRISVAFVVEEDDVVILHILYAGQQFETDVEE